MKNIKTYLFLTALIFISACDKRLETRDVDLQVDVQKTTVTVGEPVLFTFGGNEGPDILNFFSGEVYSDYNYSYGIGPGRFLVNNKGYTFSFGSRFDYNNPTPDYTSTFGRQTNQLKIFASTDFNGKLDSANVLNPASNWQDITSRFTLPSAMHASTFTASGNQELADIYVKGKPLYFAYRIVTKKQETNGYTQMWSINNFIVKSKDSIGGALVNVYDQNRLEFNFVDITKAIRESRGVTSSNLMRMGGPEAFLRPGMDTLGIDSISKVRIVANPKWRDPDSTVLWAISRPINVDSVFLGYDKTASSSIAQFTSVQFPKSFGYVYKNPGTYRAVFVGSNSSKDETKSIVKEFVITVLPKQ